MFGLSFKGKLPKIIFLIVFTMVFSSCASNKEMCSNCQMFTSDKNIVNDLSENLCANCAINSYNFSCKNCGAFSNDFYADGFCTNCYSEKCATCDLCGGGYTDKFDLVCLENDYFVCVDCIELLVKNNEQFNKFVIESSVLKH